MVDGHEMVTTYRIPLDGWEDDAGQMEFVVEIEGDLVRIELPPGHHGVITIYPMEAETLADALTNIASAVMRRDQT